MAQQYRVDEGMIRLRVVTDTFTNQQVPTLFQFADI